jgi:ankyrin repeat protein
MSKPPLLTHYFSHISFLIFLTFQLMSVQVFAQSNDVNKENALMDLLRKHSDMQTKIELNRNTINKNETIESNKQQLIRDVKQLIDAGVSVNAATDAKRSPLMQSMFNGVEEVVELLLANGAKINSRDQEGQTALMYASYSAKPAIVELLLKNGADVNLQSTGQRQHSVLNFFISNPASEDALKGQITCLKLLVKYGAKLNASIGDKNTDETPPLTVATWNNKVEIIKILLELGADIHAKDKIGATALFHACIHGHTEALQLLLQNGAQANDSSRPMGMTPLLAAIESRDEETALLILKHSSVDTINYRSPYIGGHAHGNSTALVSTIDSNMMALFKQLLDRKIDLNKSGNDRDQTPLTAATTQGKKEIAVLLISKGANIDGVNENGETPLIYTARYGSRPEMLALLLKHGAKVNAVNVEGLSALDLTSDSANREVLLKHGAISRMKNRK